VDEILTYNDVSQFEKFEPLYGLILLFKFIEEEKMTEEQLQYVNNPNIYFAKQKNYKCMCYSSTSFYNT